MNIKINTVKFINKVQEFQEYDLGQITTTLQDLLNNSSIIVDSNIIPILKITSIDNIVKNYLIKDLTENLYNTGDYITGQDLTENDLIFIVSEGQIEELKQNYTMFLNSITIPTYSAMLALPTVNYTINVKVLNDENKGIKNTIYHIYPDGVRMWIASVQDN